MRHRNRRKWFVIVPLLVIGAIFLFSWVVMLLWNAILVPAAGAGVVTIWQAMGILVLSKILFGGFSGGRRWRNRGSRDWKEKMMNMSEEEKTAFRERWRSRCGDYYSPVKTDSNASSAAQEQAG